MIRNAISIGIVKVVVPSMQDSPARSGRSQYNHFFYAHYSARNLTSEQHIWADKYHSLNGIDLHGLPKKLTEFRGYAELMLL
jgi:hypothetical protein